MHRRIHWRRRWLGRPGLKPSPKKSYLARLKSCPSRFPLRSVGGPPPRSRAARPTLRPSPFSMASPGRARLSPCRIARQTQAASAAGGLKPCPTRNACSRWFAAALAAAPIFLQANSAAPEKTQETSSPTNPTRRAQTAHVRGQVPEPQYARANLVHARSPQTAAPAGVRKRHGHRWMYKSLPPCRTVPHLASNSPARDHRDKAPCSARTESARARGFPARFSRAGSQPLPLALRPVLRRADEHFDQIIVQSVVELTLEGPFKLWMIEVARMQFEIISVHRDRRIFELNNDFYPIAFATRRELQQRMFIKPQLSEHPLEPALRVLIHEQDCS